MKAKINRILNTPFGDVLKGSTINSIAKILATGIGFLGSILIAHFYNAEIIGRIATISSIIAITTLMVMLGNQTYILRKLPTTLDKYGSQLALRIFFKIILLAGMAGLIVTTITHISLPYSVKLNASITPYQFLLYGLIFATSIKRLSLPTLRALGDYKVFSTFEILPPLFMVIAVLVGASLSIGEDFFLYIYYAPHFLLACLAFFLAKTKLVSYKSRASLPSTDLSRATPTFAQILIISTPMLGVSLSNVLIAHTDILMLGSITDEKTVGIYSIYVKICALMTIGILATISMYSPKASKFYDSGKLQELAKLTRQTTTLAFIVALVCMISILLVHKLLLSLYGDEFLMHLPTLYVLLAAMLCHAFFGPVGSLLNMTGQQNIFFRIIFMAAILNIVLNVFLIPPYGPLGAAIATLITVVFWNLLAAIRIKFVHGFTTLPIIPRLNIKIN